MARLKPFQTTGQLIADTDDFIDKVGDAILIAEKTCLQFVQEGPSDEIEDRVKQVRAVEEKADELRRGVANVMYGQMLMPDTRSDVMALLAELDTLLDLSVHVLARLDMERPALPEEHRESVERVITDSSRAAQAVLAAARAYFKEPQAVRDHVHKVAFHDKEAAVTAWRTGKAIHQTELPLERKRQLANFVMMSRELASRASDIADKLSIFAVKRSL